MMQFLSILGLVFLVAVVLPAIVLLIAAIPDLIRYMRIRSI